MDSEIRVKYVSDQQIEEQKTFDPGSGFDTIFVASQKSTLKLDVDAALNLSAFKTKHKTFLIFVT
jgi:hypothetical protein